jgi:phosphohistidine swiveling domain-containing protein
MIIECSQVTKDTKVGAKTKNLKLLRDAGFNVPDFVAISAENMPGLLLMNDFSSVAREIREKLPVERFAVRSSALVEDSKEESFAGQFHTEIDVFPDDLGDAIKKVLNQASEFLRGDLSKFSILIQDYVRADYSGVTFTRNPLGGREMVIEYHKGIGEKIVGGEITPESFKFYWGQENVRLSLPGAGKIIEAFKKIETEFGFPQDIEWCLRGGKCYFLQTRPVTTISDQEYKSVLFLEKYLPKGEMFFYEKNEISEIAARPNPFTLSLLRQIYSEEGPVKKVYHKHNLKYVVDDFLVIVGNELYVDRQKELGTLFPAYKYKGSDFTRPKLGVNGIFRTVSNFVALNKIKLDGSDSLKEKLFSSLRKDFKFENLQEAVSHFMSDYLNIFEVNLLSQKAIKALQQVVKGEKVSVAQLLVANGFGEEIQEDMKAKMSGMKGNSLDIADLSVFEIAESKTKNNTDVENWLKTIPEWKREYFEKSILLAQKYNNLREYGRWVTVKNVNYLREIFLTMAQKSGFVNLKNAFYLPLMECLQGGLNEKEANAEHELFKKFEQHSFPSSLTSFYYERRQELEGVSAGVGRGELVTLDDEALIVKGCILYTKMLSPDLTKYFDKVAGIISEEGGMLSHLAIIAREKGIPVIVHADIKKAGFNIGDIIKIDGSTGEILSVD